MARITLAAALFGGAAAQIGSWQEMAGYKSASDVGPHAKIDLDMAEFETTVGTHGTDADWITKAMFIFDNGGGGLCSASDVTAGTAAGSTTTPWCTDTTKALGNSQKSTSVRTLKGFATKDYSTDKLTGKDGGKYGEQLPPIYTAYWADSTKGGYTAAQAAIWADTFVRKDYTSIVQSAGSNQLMKKGANYQAVWMYVLHELEDAIGDCYAGDITANDATPTGGAPHAWDEGWAFYAGSLIGATAADAAKTSTASSEGTLIWELSEKRGADFGTLDTTGPSKANVGLVADFIDGRDKIIAANCAGAEPVIDKIITKMTIPLIQGTIKYAWKADPANAGDCSADAGKTALTASDNCVKSWTEGWAFAAALLPQLDQCDPEVASVVRHNLDAGATGPMQCGFATVKTAIESCYTKLGVTCADIGAFQSSTGVYAGADACTTIPAKPALATCSAKFPATAAPVPVAGCEAPASDDATAPALALGAAAAAAGAALLL